MSDLVSTSSFSALGVILFFMLAILIDASCYLIVVLIYISLTTTDIWHFFQVLCICISSLVKYLFCWFSNWIIFKR